MPRNGSGTYTLPQAAFTPNTTISSAAVDSDFSDIASQLTNSLAADGQTTMTGPIKAVTGSAASPSYTFGTNTNTGFYSAGANVIGVAAGGVAVGQITSAGIANTNGVPVSIPVGTVVDFAGAVAPPGWYLCYGQSVATATYPALFTAIGYVYGGSGPNFNLPDCRGRATFGKDNMGGSTAGRITVAAGNFDGTVLGGTGGGQTSLILSTNLPSASVSGSATIPAGGGSHVHSDTALRSASQGGAGSGNFLGTSQTLNTAAATLPQLNGSCFISGLGNDTPLPTLSNAIIFNKIIFAGA